MLTKADALRRQDQIQELFRLGVRYPQERIAVRERQLRRESLSGDSLIGRVLEEGIISRGDIKVAEVAPTYRCPLNCNGCVDASSNIQEMINQGLIPKNEIHVSPEVIKKRIKLLEEIGVRHFMFIGGTIDYLEELPEYIKYTLGLGTNIRVSWFTDGIPQLEEATGRPSDLLKNHVKDGWIKQVATHLSLDYPYGYGFDYPGNIFEEDTPVPRRAGSVKAMRNNPDYSRQYKSQFGIVAARELIKNQVRRVVLNTTISSGNAPFLYQLYQQAEQLQEYAKHIDSPTEVLWTFSPWIWRPYQARGDDPKVHSSVDGIGEGEIGEVNKVLQLILADTYSRIKNNGLSRPRILANSSGYTFLHASSDPNTQQIAIEEDVGYLDGKPLMFNVDPGGDIQVDPMRFSFSELPYIRSTYGYMDRPYEKDSNLFTAFQDHNFFWFPNIVST